MKRIALFSCMALGAFCLASAIYIYRLYAEKRAHHLAGIPIHIIAQTGPEKRALKTDYLAELLELSKEGFQATFTEKDAQRKLLKSPVIKKAQVKLISKGILSIDYSLRKPYVFLADYQNLALDREGVPFPFSPFYTPKNMPFLYLGEREVKWGHPVESRELAFEILSFLEKEVGLEQVESLDVSKAQHDSLGRREVVLVLKEAKGRCFLRLTPLGYVDELKRYRLLQCEEGELIVDLRLPKLAFIKEKEGT